eukprot:9575531-Heterocapsa_arctica.AAC.1
MLTIRPTTSCFGVFGVSKPSGRALAITIGCAIKCRARKVQRITKTRKTVIGESSRYHHQMRNDIWSQKSSTDL